MILPNAYLAVVAPEKIVDYLLNPAHPDNGGKAAFFLSMGFTANGWAILAESFTQLALHTPVTSCVKSVHGEKYVIDGTIQTPRGVRPRVRTIWIIDSGAANPRLVTAYPAEQ
jgi:hypothetical protein